MFWFQMLIARGASLAAQNANGYASLKYSYANVPLFKDGGFVVIMTCEIPHRLERRTKHFL